MHSLKYKFQKIEKKVQSISKKLPEIDLEPEQQLNPQYHI